MQREILPIPILKYIKSNILQCIYHTPLRPSFLIIFSQVQEENHLIITILNQSIVLQQLENKTKTLED